MSGQADEEAMDRIEERRLDEALWQLDAEELDELRELEADRGLAGSEALRDDAERCAALISSASAASDAGPMPASLVTALQREARAFAREAEATEEARKGPRPHAPQEPQAEIEDRRGAGGTFFLAAAAALFAFLSGFMLKMPNGAAKKAPRVDLAAERAALLEAPERLLIDWKRGPSALAGATSGDVVWSDREQRGYMRFRGLPVNDANARQYQLWIFDAKRDAARPVDGGVFDIPAGASEVLVPIEAAIRVHRASAFAVTVEEPGGVVVSKREHIVATAGL